MDIEGLDMHLITKTLFTTSGQSPKRKVKAGMLYQVNKDTGVLTSFCHTGLDGISALSFHPTQHDLWVWANGQGLFTINTTQTKENRCAITQIFPSTADVEALAWGNQGQKLYGVVGSTLYQYENNVVSEKCTNFPAKTEALDTVVFNEKELLLFAVHGKKDTCIHSFNVDTCSIVDIAPLPVDTDIEDLAIEGQALECD